MITEYVKQVIVSIIMMASMWIDPKEQNMNIQEQQNQDSKKLSELNAKFIDNFINQDVEAHEEIIYKDFVCIQGSGQIVNREEYMKEWAEGYSKSGYKTFHFTDENIRIFGNMAIVRSKTVYTKLVNGDLITGNSIYTDTYIKENGRWWCVQAHITPIK